MTTEKNDNLQESIVFRNPNSESSFSLKPPELFDPGLTTDYIQMFFNLKRVNTRTVFIPFSIFQQEFRRQNMREFSDILASAPCSMACSGVPQCVIW